MTIGRIDLQPSLIWHGGQQTVSVPTATTERGKHRKCPCQPPAEMGGNTLSWKIVALSITMEYVICFNMTEYSF